MTGAEEGCPQDASLVAGALSTIRKGILSGEYPPGSWLRLNKLTGETGTSLIPVREALRILETERLVESLPNRGARVVPISKADMDDLYTVRTLLEVEAVCRSAQLEQVERQRLDEILARVRRAVSKGDRDEVIRLNRDFHFALYRRCGSPWLLYLIEMLWNHNERYQRLSLNFRHDAADAEHSAIVEALADGDAVTAAEALRVHLRATPAGIAEIFETSSDSEE